MYPPMHPSTLPTLAAMEKTELELELELELDQLDPDKLQALRVLGSGAMGTVFLTGGADRRQFAVKVVDKQAMAGKPDTNRRARWEMTVLSRLSHPFLPKLLAAGETRDLLLWAIPYCTGGDLNQLRHRQVEKVFSMAAIRFYAAEIVLALDHLHRLGVVYRDLKPENVLVQSSGHIMLTDFDLSRHFPRPPSPPPQPPQPPLPLPPPLPSRRRRWEAKKVKSARILPAGKRRGEPGDARSYSFVGTEEYVSPEVVRGEGHEFAVDWWALGVLVYEMAHGRTPFRGRSRKETFANVLGCQPAFDGKPTVLTDLVSGLLEKDPARRLGYRGGSGEVMRHPFFDGVRWEMLPEVARPPFLPAGEEDAAVPAAGKEAMTIGGYFERQRRPPEAASPVISFSLPSPPNCDGLRDDSLTEF